MNKNRIQDDSQNNDLRSVISTRENFKVNKEFKYRLMN